MAVNKKIPETWTIVPTQDLCVAVPQNERLTIDQALSRFRAHPAHRIAVNLVRIQDCNQCVLNPNNSGYTADTTRLFQETVATCSTLSKDTLTAQLQLKGEDPRNSLASLTTYPFPAKCDALTPRSKRH